MSSQCRCSDGGVAAGDRGGVQNAEWMRISDELSELRRPRRLPGTRGPDRATGRLRRGNGRGDDCGRALGFFLGSRSGPGAPKLAAGGPETGRGRRHPASAASQHAIGASSSRGGPVRRVETPSAMLWRPARPWSGAARECSLSRRCRRDQRRAGPTRLEGRPVGRSGRPGNEVRHRPGSGHRKSPNDPAIAEQLATAEAIMGNSYAEKALWAEAAEAMARAVRHGMSGPRRWRPAGEPAGGTPRSRRGLKLCTGGARATTAGPGQSLVASGLARWCAWCPGVVPDPGRLLSLARTGRASGHTGPLRVFSLSLAEYRAGRFEDAIRRARESLAGRRGRNGPLAATDAAILAMAHYRLGQGEEARAGSTRSLASTGGPSSGGPTLKPGGSEAISSC